MADKKKPKAAAKVVAVAVPKVASNGILGIAESITEVQALAKKVGGFSELQKTVVALHG